MCQGTTSTCGSDSGTSSFHTPSTLNSDSTGGSVSSSSGVEMEGMRGAFSLGDVGVTDRQSCHFTSTPHLFAFHNNEEEEEVKTQIQGLYGTEKPEPIYSSTSNIRKTAAVTEVEAAQQISEKYDSMKKMTEQKAREEVQGEPGLEEEGFDEDPLEVTDDDLVRLETFFQGHKTQVHVCNTMANLYTKGITDDADWELKFTGVPVIVLDEGHTKSRNQRRLQIILAEKCTGFALWKDVVDNLTSYKAQEPQFHTLYISSDHRRRVGLSFNEARAAKEFHDTLAKLAADPANIAFTLGNSKTKKKSKSKEKVPKYKAPRKTEISLPCNFQHVTNVDACDKGRLFSLRLFSKAYSSSTEVHAVIDRPNISDTDSVVTSDTVIANEAVIANEGVITENAVDATDNIVSHSAMNTRGNEIPTRM